MSAKRTPLPLAPHSPEKYTGPSKAEVLALRRQYLSPGLITYYADPLMKQPPRGICVYPANVVWSSMLFRGALDLLDRWASGRGEPPPALTW